MKEPIKMTAAELGELDRRAATQVMGWEIHIPSLESKYQTYYQNNPLGSKLVL